MTDAVTASPAAVPAESSVLLHLGDCMRRLAGLGGVAALLEDASGRLLTHAFAQPELGGLLVQAVVQGTTQQLHAHLCERRVTGLLCGAPVIEGRLEQQPVMLMSLPGAVVWLVTDRTVSLSPLQQPLERLAHLTGLTAREPVASCLDGGPLPAELAGLERFWTARLDAPVVAELILASLPSHVGGAAVSGVQHQGRAYAVLGTHGGVEESAALRAVTRLHRLAQQRLGHPLTVSLSESGSHIGLSHARRQADLALEAIAIGSCMSIGQVRARMVLQSLGGALRSSSALCADPLDDLLAYDEQTQGRLAASLLAWLNRFGDARGTADSLGIHVNTLRYRLQRAEQLLGISLREDQESRTLVHLQLLTAGDRNNDRGPDPDPWSQAPSSGGK